jgi:hypothetical protein
MLLRSGGLDIFYIDESNDSHIYVVAAVAVPFLRESAGIWNIVWPDYLQAAKEWRRRIRDALDIPVSKELHGVKLASGRGRYVRGKFSSTVQRLAQPIERFSGWQISFLMHRLSQ